MLSTIVCHSLETCRQRLDAGALFGNAPRALWSRWVTPDKDNLLPLACRCLLIDVGGVRILLETGLDRFMEPALAERYGVSGAAGGLLRELERCGYTEDDIDFVILSHLHFDHAGGLVPAWPGLQAPDWQLRFPHANYIVSRVQYERAAAPTPRDRASYIPELPAVLERSGRLMLVEPGAPNVPGLPEGITFCHSDGHTPGMLLTRLQGQTRTLLFGGDLLPGRHWLHLPIVTGYDRFAERSVEEKKALLEPAVDGGWTIFFTHDPDAAAAGIGRDAKGRFCAVQVEPELNGFEL